MQRIFNDEQRQSGDISPNPTGRRPFCRSQRCKSLAMNHIAADFAPREATKRAAATGHTVYAFTA